MQQDSDALVLLGGHVSEEEETGKMMLQVPIKVTTPRRGPLQLANGSFHAINSATDRHYTCQPLSTVHLPSIRLSRWDSLKHHGDAQKPRSLTRFPVLDIRRPLEEVEDQLSGLTRVDIKNSMSVWKIGNVSSNYETLNT